MNPIDSTQIKLIKELKQLLTQEKITLEQIKEIATNGLPNNSYRKILWPILLGIENINEKNDSTEIRYHRDTNQVKQDVDRCLWKDSLGWSEIKKTRKREKLQRIIDKIMCKYESSLYYYQGFHEVCSVFLTIFGEKKSFFLSENVALYFMHDNMNKNFNVVLKYLDIIYALILHIDPNLHKFLQDASMNTFFATSWVLTWFSHVVSEMKSIFRLFDFFLSEHPLMPYYYSAALILYNNNLIQKCECSMSDVFNCLQSLVTEMNVEDVILIARKLMQLYPPKVILEEMKVQITQEFHSVHFPILKGFDKIQNDMISFEITVDAKNFLLQFLDNQDSDNPILQKKPPQNTKSKLIAFVNRRKKKKPISKELQINKQLQKVFSSKFEKNHPLFVLVKPSQSWVYLILQRFKIIILIFIIILFVFFFLY
ncbi:tbc1 domain family member 20/gtpase [Anaeramoeba ignava]|uniref:Tbc1 domain family member 20/gtpase n=1 Tax=Anaeramoeba ignava TaxID=1746090 RepID=A0A9Q0RCH4_ANAIG|nr:tbc1 domain family member 20/gtpase [Anaeramoeba ignava]